MSTIASPLTGRPSVRVLREYSRDQLCQEWQDAFGIDIRPELEGAERIQKCQCLDSYLVFYHPNCVAGSPSLYEKLCRFKWYYQERKWEHDVALRLCRGRESILEIGCGSGNFLRRVAERMPDVRAVGLEINEAVEVSEFSAGFELVHGEFSEFSAAHESEFDLVCSFQVLEHVVDPLRFVQLSCTAAKKGGLVVFGTPNAESFLKYSHNLLDLPPHHMSGWSRRTYEFLPKVAPLRLLKLLAEPLALYHLDYYMHTCFDRFNKTSDPRRLLYNGKLGESQRAILQAGLRRFITGQSILAVYEKI
jgi:SAM-dependent methyltransferase